MRDLGVRTPCAQRCLALHPLPAQRTLPALRMLPELIGCRQLPSSPAKSSPPSERHPSRRGEVALLHYVRTSNLLPPTYAKRRLKVGEPMPTPKPLSIGLRLR